MTFENPFGVAELVELGGSAAVVLLMVGVAAVLGFRMSARIDDGELTRLAAAEGAILNGAVIAPNGRTAFARLSDGRVMVARVMGADVSARFAPANAVKLDVKARRLNATFADVGFPPLKMRIEDSPAWLNEFSSGGGSST
jgi:phosphohistidine swiveling domain-containing protein